MGKEEGREGKTTEIHNYLVEGTKVVYPRVQIVGVREKLTLKYSLGKRQLRAWPPASHP